MGVRGLLRYFSPGLPLRTRRNFITVYGYIEVCGFLFLYNFTFSSSSTWQRKLHIRTRAEAREFGLEIDGNAWRMFEKEKGGQTTHPPWAYNLEGGGVRLRPFVKKEHRQH
jgi:hypothetical protein